MSTIIHKKSYLIIDYKFTSKNLYLTPFFYFPSLFRTSLSLRLSSRQLLSFSRHIPSLFWLETLDCKGDVILFPLTMKPWDFINLTEKFVICWETDTETKKVKLRNSIRFVYKVVKRSLKATFKVLQRDMRLRTRERSWVEFLRSDTFPSYSEMDFDPHQKGDPTQWRSYFKDSPINVVQSLVQKGKWLKVVESGLKVQFRHIVVVLVYVYPLRLTVRPNPISLDVTLKFLDYIFSIKDRESFQNLNCPYTRLSLFLCLIVISPSYTTYVLLVSFVILSFSNSPPLTSTQNHQNQGLEKKKKIAHVNLHMW